MWSFLITTILTNPRDCQSLRPDWPGLILMEPVFMILGQSAATAASLAIDASAAVQDIEYEKLRGQLLKDAQVLEYGK